MDVDSWKRIHGWLSDAGGEKLQELASGKAVLKIGAYHGRSTVCMATVAKKVVSVDWHMGGEDGASVIVVIQRPNAQPNEFAQILENALTQCRSWL